MTFYRCDFCKTTRERPLRGVIQIMTKCPEKAHTQFDICEECLVSLEHMQRQSVSLSSALSKYNNPLEKDK